MSYLDVYIGNLSSPNFSWENGNYNNNIPQMISPYFPLPAPFCELIQKIEKGELNGARTDWGSYTAKVTKKQIKAFVEEFYSGYVERQDQKYFQRQINQYNDLIKCIETLDPDKEYGLVACEL
ncbi:MAG: hypothetical protein Q8Q37_02075 [bacterium]|nr:hypothetical protein [bacterium]